MKRTLYILTIILMNLLPLVSVEAQILEKQETKSLLIYPFNYRVNGLFDIKSDNSLKKYFVDVNGVLRIDEKTIALKTKDQFYAQIRIEVDKGSLFLGAKKESKGPGYHFYHNIKISEGKLDYPVIINAWGVNRLQYVDRDITISIYDMNTDQLLEKKKYRLTPDSVFIYQPILHYTDLSGERKQMNSMRGYFFLGSDINYNQTMKLEFDDGWDRKYKVLSHCIRRTDVMCSTLPLTGEGDTLTAREKRQLQGLSRDRTIYISNITVKTKDGGKMIMSPIEVIKK